MNFEPFLTALGQSSAKAGVLVLIVLAIQFAFKTRLSPQWRCALWLLPALRLLFPVSVSTSSSIYNLVPRSEQSAVSTYAGAHQASPSNTVTIPSQKGGSFETGGRVASPEVQKFRWDIPLFIIWICGTAPFLTKVICNARLLSRQFKDSKEITDSKTIALFESCREASAVNTRVLLVENDRASSPFLYGCLCPHLVLPKRLRDDLSRDELRFVFLHELAHVKRRDILLNWFSTILQALHWFNPLIWIGSSRWRRDRELACDALVLEVAGEHKKIDYGRTILRLLESSAAGLKSPAMVGISEGTLQLQERISMIASFGPRKRWSALGFALILFAGTIGLTDAQVPILEQKVKAASRDVPPEQIHVNQEARVVPETSRLSERTEPAKEELKTVNSTIQVDLSVPAAILNPRAPEVEARQHDQPHPANKVIAPASAIGTGEIPIDPTREISSSVVHAKLEDQKTTESVVVLQPDKKSLPSQLLAPAKSKHSNSLFENRSIPSEPGPDFAISISNSVATLEIDLSAAIHELSGVTSNSEELLYFCIRDARCPIRPPTVRVYLTSATETNLAPSRSNFLGVLRFEKYSLFAKQSRARVMFAVPKSVVRSIANAGGKAVATFVIEDEAAASQLKSKPISLSEISFEIQRRK